MKAGYYALVNKDHAADLEEAIEITKRRAVEGISGFDPESLEVNRHKTGINEAGHYLVGLLGRTRVSLARERAREEAKISRREKSDE